MQQAERNLRAALAFIAEARNSVAAEHPELARYFDNILQDIDHDRHNVILLKQRIFFRSRAVKYSRDELDKIIAETPPVRHLDRAGG
jgi:hypothetical protein